MHSHTQSLFAGHIHDPDVTLGQSLNTSTIIHCIINRLQLDFSADGHSALKFSEQNCERKRRWCVLLLSLWSDTKHISVLVIFQKPSLTFFWLLNETARLEPRQGTGQGLLFSSQIGCTGAASAHSAASPASAVQSSISKRRHTAWLTGQGWQMGSAVVSAVACVLLSCY